MPEQHIELRNPKDQIRNDEIFALRENQTKLRGGLAELNFSNSNDSVIRHDEFGTRRKQFFET
jgi:hypothetical protein